MSLVRGALPSHAGEDARWGDSGPIPGQHFGDEFSDNTVADAVMVKLREAWDKVPAKGR